MEVYCEKAQTRAAAEADSLIAATLRRTSCYGGQRRRPWERSDDGYITYEMTTVTGLYSEEWIFSHAERRSKMPGAPRSGASEGIMPSIIKLPYVKLKSKFFDNHSNFIGKKAAHDDNTAWQCQDLFCSRSGALHYALSALKSSGQRTEILEIQEPSSSRRVDSLLLAEGDESKWDAATLTYADGANKVIVSGVGASAIELRFGATGYENEYNTLAARGVFA